MVTNADDDRLLAALTACVGRVDPVPSEVAPAARRTFELRLVDAELAALLVESDSERELVFREDSDTTALRFVGSGLTIEIEIDSTHHAVGVLEPPVRTTVVLERSTPAGSDTAAPEQSDPLGRFQVDTGPGLCRLRIGSGSDQIVTAWFEG